MIQMTPSMYSCWSFCLLIYDSGPFDLFCCLHVLLYFFLCSSESSSDDDSDEEELRKEIEKMKKEQELRRQRIEAEENKLKQGKFVSFIHNLSRMSHFSCFNIVW